MKIIDSGEPLTEAALGLAEKRMGRAIPVSYRQFLLKHNGGYPDLSDFRMRVNRPNISDLGSVDRFLGVHGEATDDLEHYLDTYRDRLPANLFPIAHDAGGNLVCVSTGVGDDGKVYFWDHEFEADEGEPPGHENIYSIADSFEEFINGLG